MNIPVGAEWVNITNGETIIVLTDSTVCLREEKTSFINATATLDKDYQAATDLYRIYKGRKLRDI